jgi:hypothetical protein
MVPVAGNAFKSTTMAVAYDTNGNPTSVEIANQTALITTATSTAKSAATSIVGIPAAISSTKLAQTQAEANQANADVALASARAGAEEAIETAAAKAQTDLLAAKAALAKAQSDGQSGPDLLALQSQTALLNAQQAQLTAQQALDAAKKVQLK